MTLRELLKILYENPLALINQKIEAGNPAPVTPVATSAGSGTAAGAEPPPSARTAAAASSDDGKGIGPQDVDVTVNLHEGTPLVSGRPINTVPAVIGRLRKILGTLFTQGTFLPPVSLSTTTAQSLQLLTPQAPFFDQLCMLYLKAAQEGREGDAKRYLANINHRIQQIIHFFTQQLRRDESASQENFQVILEENLQNDRPACLELLVFLKELKKFSHLLEVDEDAVNEEIVLEGQRVKVPEDLKKLFNQSLLAKILAAAASHEPAPADTAPAAAAGATVPTGVSGHDQTRQVFFTQLYELGQFFKRIEGAHVSKEYILQNTRQLRSGESRTRAYFNIQKYYEDLSALFEKFLQLLLFLKKNPHLGGFQVASLLEYFGKKLTTILNKNFWQAVAGEASFPDLCENVRKTVFLIFSGLFVEMGKCCGFTGMGEASLVNFGARLGFIPAIQTRGMLSRTAMTGMGVTTALILFALIAFLIYSKITGMRFSPASEIFGPFRGGMQTENFTALVNFEDSLAQGIERGMSSSLYLAFGAVFLLLFINGYWQYRVAILERTMERNADRDGALLWHNDENVFERILRLARRLPKADVFNLLREKAASFTSGGEIPPAAGGRDLPNADRYPLPFEATTAHQRIAPPAAIAALAQPLPIPRPPTGARTLVSAAGSAPSEFLTPSGLDPAAIVRPGALQVTLLRRPGLPSDDDELPSTVILSHVRSAEDLSDYPYAQLPRGPAARGRRRATHPMLPSPLATAAALLPGAPDLAASGRQLDQPPTGPRPLWPT